MMSVMRLLPAATVQALPSFERMPEPHRDSRGPRLIRQESRMSLGEGSQVRFHGKHEGGRR